MFIVGLGAILFGLTIGWIVYRIVRLRAGAPWQSDLTAILGVIAGAAVLAFFRSDVLFGWYSIGLILGFGAYFGVGFVLHRKEELQFWRLEQVPSTSTPNQVLPTSTPDQELHTP
jgi:hypothetical protein